MTQKKPLCVSIGPYGATEVEQSYRKDLEIVLKEALEPKYDYKPFWALPKIDMASDIFSNLIDADLVIADLRGVNPNVMYELGLRHAFNKATLHLIDHNTDAPWDIDKNYLIRYQAPLQVSQKDKLISEITERIQKINEITLKPNPVFNTFVSHYKNSASVENFKGDADTKIVLQNLLGAILSVQSQVQAMAAASNRYNPWGEYFVNGGGLPDSMTLSGLAGAKALDAEEARTRLETFLKPKPSSKS